MNKQKGFSTLLGILLALAILGGGTYFYVQKNVPINTPNENNTTDNTLIEEEAKKTSGSDIKEPTIKTSERVNVTTGGFGDKNKIIKEVQSGFSMIYPKSWGEPEIDTQFNPGKSIEQGEKSYMDPLAFTSLFEPEVKISFPSLDSVYDVYNPEIFLLRKDSVEAGFNKDLLTKIITKHQAHQDSGVLAEKRRAFLDCSQSDMFWYFGYCEGKILNPVSIADSGRMILGFMPNQIGTSYDYGFIINGSQYYGLILLNQNSESDFYKKNVFIEKSKPLSINHFRIDGSIDIVNYDSIFLTFMNPKSSIDEEDKTKFLSEIGPVLESITIK